MVKVSALQLNDGHAVDRSAVLQCIKHFSRLIGIILSSIVAESDFTEGRAGLYQFLGKGVELLLDCQRYSVVLHGQRTEIVALGKEPVEGHYLWIGLVWHIGPVSESQVLQTSDRYLRRSDTANQTGNV